MALLIFNCKTANRIFLSDLSKTIQIINTKLKPNFQNSHSHNSTGSKHFRGEESTKFLPYDYGFASIHVYAPK